MVITLRDVKYVPNIDYNLLSLTSVMDKGYQLLVTDEELSIKKKNNVRIRLNRKLKTSGNLYGIKMIPNCATSETKNEEKEMEFNDYHRNL